LYGGAIYSNNDFAGFYFIDNLFTKNSAINGGAIYKKSNGINLYIIHSSLKSLENPNKQFVPSVILHENYFQDNIASKSGGVAFLNGESIILNNTEFSKNKAQNGGVLFFLNIGK